MTELIDERTANLLMNLLAVGLPLAGLVAGAIAAARPRAAIAAAARRRAVTAGALRGLAFGCVGIANWLLWRLYNATTNHFGLDTVKNLLINLGLFLALGVSAGVVVGLWAAKRRNA